MLNRVNSKDQTHKTMRGNNLSFSLFILLSVKSAAVFVEKKRRREEEKRRREEGIMT